MIKKGYTIEEIAAVVSDSLSRENITAVLSGGAVVSIYSKNEYESKDLDFVSAATLKTINSVMTKLGFQKTQARYFTHPNTEYFVEFPSAPLAIGDEILTEWGERRTDKGSIQILTPTQCVMDRLSGYIHWKDPQNLEQAVMVAKQQPVNLDRIRSWTKSEDAEFAFEDFQKALTSKSK